MKDGIIKGNHAHVYDKATFNKKNRKNSFIARNIKGKNNIIADIGCGSGVSLEQLQKSSKKIYAIDPSEEMIKICRDRFKDNKIKFIVADATKLPIKDKTCDFAIMRMTLHHIKNKQEALNEVWRILKPSGYLLLIDKFRIHSAIKTYFLDIIRNIAMGLDLFQHHYIEKSEFKKIILGIFIIKEEHYQEKRLLLKSTIVLKKSNRCNH